MPKDLERDLGLYATVTISIGAMIGSGIFVLPGLATKIAGPAAILAYLCAGLLVLPAALSKAEMATAMPEAGGTYLYIDRAMGPLPGTIAGIGAWFSLVFKSAFALVGLGAYLLLFAPGLAGVVKLVALALAVLLLVVNVAGAKQSGGLQATIVTLVLVALVAFIADGLTFVEQARYHPFFVGGAGGLLEATGFVFVSYAGVTKIASVAEEVENPGRNIPLGIIVSIVSMMLVYTFVVFVVVGVAPADELAKTLTPMALAAASFAGRTGEIAVAVVAVLALTSMANAGILSSTRFPLAMSRDDLAPAALGAISERFRTPVYSIAFTGTVLLVLIAAVPVVKLAKLASAFQILVFAFENVALVAFRESDLRSYEPEFVAPGYPWLQLAGILGGVVLLTQMGAVPLAGAAAMVAFGAAWYRLYGRERTEREGAAIDAIRHRTDRLSVERTERQLTTGGGGGVLVAVGADTAMDHEATLLRIAQSVVKRRGGQIHVALFEEVPDQVTLSSAAEVRTDADAAFEDATDRLARDLDVPVVVEEIVSHDVEHGVANHLETCGANLLLGEFEPDPYHGELLGTDVDWYMNNVGADVAFVRDRGFGTVEEIAVVAGDGPIDPLAVLIADAIAFEHDATLRFLYWLPDDAPADRRGATERFHQGLREVCNVPTEYEIHRSDDRLGTVAPAVGDADLAVVGTVPHNVAYDVMVGSFPDELAETVDCTTLLVRSNRQRRHTFIRYLLQRFVF